MSHIVLRAAVIVALPALVFFGGAEIMTRLSGRARVAQRLARLPEADRKPLNQRPHYDRAAVERQWAALDEDADALAAEARFLELDLVFPLLYGGAFAAALLMAWAALGRPFNPAWLIALVGVTVISDWTENLLILQQLTRYTTRGAPALDSTRIAVASGATLVKLAGAAALSGLTLVLVVLMFRRSNP